MIKQPSVLLSIQPLAKHGLYSAKVRFRDIEYDFEITVDDSGIPVAFGGKRLFAVLGDDIDCYTNVLKAVRQKHFKQDVTLPADLSTLKSLDSSDTE